MNMEATKESTALREGKSYGYQRPQESATGDAGAADDKRKNLVSAFEAFIDSLAVPAAPCAPTTGSPTTGSPTTGSPTTGSPTTGSPTTGSPTTGSPTTGSPTTGSPTTGSPPTGYPTTGSPTTGSPTTGSPTTGSPTTEGEAPTGESIMAAREALEMSIFSQREAYRLDRERETSRHTNRNHESSPTASPGHVESGGIAIIGAPVDKHQSDSNRAPLTDSREFAPAFGSIGKSVAATMERMSVPAARPETVPAIGIVSPGRPIDAYWASFGTAIERAAVRANLEYTKLEVIIGTDDRVRVTNNTLYPWRCICSLLITTRNGTQYIGTGWLVAPRLVLTAGHCVYMADEGGWASQIEVIPGRNGTQRPFGSAICRDMRSVSGWTRDNDQDFDYGAILLPPDKRFGEQLGWFGYAARPDDYLRQVTLNLSGYPGDGGKAPNQEAGTQWYHSRRVKDVMARQVTYEIDTYGGQSGAPVWEMTSAGHRYGMAIHTWGTSVSNGATRITSQVFDNIVLWAGQAP